MSVGMTLGRSTVQLYLEHNFTIYYIRLRVACQRDDWKLTF